MSEQKPTYRSAASIDAMQGAILYRHGEPHTVLWVKDGLIAGPHIRTHCPSNRTDGSTSCGDLTAISGFLVKL